jgi:2-oxoglutarate dehydrogenase E2 component (dihydrolipoamide succinyltransferase)
MAGGLIDIVVPLEQEGTKAVVRTWLKKPGDAVAEHDALLELETDKVSVEVAAPSAGVLAEVLLEAGADAPPGTLLGRLRVNGAGEASDGEEAPVEGPALAADEEAAPQPESDHTAEVPTEPAKPKRPIGSFDPALRLSPSVRRLLVENDVEPDGMTGTGRDGRLTRDDVASEIERRAKAPAVARPTTPAPASVAGARRIPHDGMRRRIAEHMSRSVATAPHVTAVFEADFTAISAHRAAAKGALAKRGVNLTYTAYLLVAAAEAMKVAPAVNSRWHEDFLEVFDDVNIGVGTALGDKGLIVPVVPRVQALSLEGVAERLHELTERARADKLKPADVQGGTFSISNHGVSGSLLASPIIINQPQSAILGVGKLERRVVVRQVDGADAILVRPMAYVTLTIDHRALDGAQTNAWLTRFVEVLEGWPAA